MSFMKKLLPVVAIVSLVAGALVVSAPNAYALGDKHNEAQTPLTRMFVWWNEAFKEKGAFTKEAFAKYFTPDAAIIINGKERVRGLDNLVIHFNRIQGQAEKVDMVVPFKEEFVSEDGTKVFTHHVIHSRADGKDSTSELMGYAIIKNNKVDLVNFISIEVSENE